jgi:hypothetical protein
MKRVTINIVDDKNMDWLQIPISEDELRAMFDMGFFMMNKNMQHWLKINYMDKPANLMFRKFWHVVNDVLDEGKCYHYGKIEKKKYKRGKLSKERFYLVGKPEWNCTYDNAFFRKKKLKR